MPVSRPRLAGSASEPRLIAGGDLDVPIANVYPLAQVREACTELERRHAHGKIVLRA
jgi:NADPH:quinone reductase-like Zn-dependent oxidoreductase